MNDYIIYTDSACDISPAILAEWGVGFSCLTFRFNDSDTEYSNNDMDVKTFYDKMRAGGIAKTAAINASTFAEEFEKILKDGKDILYIGFSSGLSSTYNAAVIAAKQLTPLYPERKILTVDTLAASAGQGMIVYLTAEQKKKGASVEEAAKYAEDIKLHLCHWFTISDLVYLKRGGRISATSAFVGNTLGIKPVLHVDNNGHLINMSKVRGRKSALAALDAKYGELASEIGSAPVFICQSDCADEANEVAAALKSKYNATVDIITDIGPVIGAHTGPGTIGLFFLAKER